MLALRGWSSTHLLNGVISGGHIGLGTLIWSAELPIVRVIGFVLLGAGSFIGWLASFKRYHLVADTPTSRITTAAQGYIELVGRSELHPGASSVGSHADMPCVWQRYVVYRKNGEKWSVVDRGQTDTTFLLVDDSGECVIDPEQAEVFTTHRRTSHSSDYKRVVEYLRPMDTLYALGELATHNSSRTHVHKGDDVRSLLTEWKENKQTLLERFDHNEDGQVDVQEWQEARKAAQKEVNERHRDMQSSPDVHVLRAPKDGRPFLLSNRDPDRLARLYQWWSWLHLAVFATAAVASLVLWGRDSF